MSITASEHLELYREGKVGFTATGDYVPTAQDLVDREISRTTRMLDIESYGDPLQMLAGTELGRQADLSRDIDESLLIGYGFRKQRHDADLERGMDVERLRRQFDGMFDWQRDGLDHYMDGQDAAFLETRKRPDVDWATHLAEASPDELINFAQWNSDRVIAVNSDPDMQDAIAANRERYKQLLADAVESDGPFPRSALDKLPGIDDVPVIFGDVLDVEMQGRSGYYGGRYDAVVLGQTDGMKSLGHEMGHARLGNFPVAHFNEGMTEQSTIGLRTGNFLRVSPYETSDYGSYPWNRFALANVARAGKQPLGEELLLEAFIEDDPYGQKAVELAERSAESFPGVDDIWAETSRNALDHAAKVHRRFPGTFPGFAMEMGDMYAGYQVSALGAMLRNDPTYYIRGGLEAQADGYHAHYLKAQELHDEDHDFNLSYIKAKAYTARRLLQDFDLDVLYPV